MSETLNKIVQHLELAKSLHQRVEQHNMTRSLRALQEWQTKRLLTTHQDLWQSKRFKPAMSFFIDELYGPKDFSKRDSDIARVVPKMAKLLPQQALDSLESALRLNSLSFELDVKMSEQLEQTPVDRHTYAQAYQRCDNFNQREEQISLLESLGEDLAEVVKIPGISALLMLSRKPAKMAGVESLQVFLESGFKAFKKLGNVEDFIVPIVSRERQMMHALFDAEDLLTMNPLPEVVI
ncbi:MAG: hypothetical protein Alis3KO_08350 [Aliiglaciecola sp.]